MKTIEIPYAPRFHQRQIHKERRKNTVLVCHRRFGKTVLAVNELINSALICPLKNPRLAYIAPQRNQAKAVAWDYLKHYSRVIPGASFNEAELRADFPNGGRVTLYGADNPDALRGLYLDGIVPDEVAQMPPRLMREVITPALLDRSGWRMSIGTPSGHNAFYEAYQTALVEMRAGNPDWYAGMFRASETGILPADALAEARKQMTPEEYEQEFECSFEAAIQGAYYGKELAIADREGRIGNCPIDGSLPVHTAWDLGQADATSIWFYQVVRGGSLRLVDYYEASGAGFDHYAKVLFTDKRYVYGTHTAPHDIRVREFSGKSRLETAAGLGINFQIAPQMGIQDGIDAARMLIARCWFDAVRCKDGIEALKLYRQDRHDRTGTWTGKPVHDWTSHAADAFRYLAVCPDVAFESARNQFTKADHGAPAWMRDTDQTDYTDYDPLGRR